MLKLDKKATFIETGAGEKEIFSRVDGYLQNVIPAVTPKFAQHFGLANWL